MHKRNEPSTKAIGERIRALRRVRHLTQAELASRIGIRAGPMNALENGRHVPSGRVLFRLAEILDASVDEILGLAERRSFAAPGPTQVADSSTAGKTEPGAVMVKLNDDPPPDAVALAITGQAIDAFLALEDLCGAQKRAHIPLYVPFARNAGSIEQWAQQVRQVVGIGQGVIFDYLELLENAGMRIVFCPFSERYPSMAFYDARNANAFIFVRQGMNAERQLFEMIKRLGSIYLHTRRIYGQGACNGEDKLDDTHAARQFAAFFLMPAASVRASVAQVGVAPGDWNYDLLLRLKHRFGVSAQAFLMRLGELRLIDGKIAAGLRERIEGHYQRTKFGEPDSTKRILSPNGRLGDLLLIAQRNPKAAEEAEAIGRRLRELKLEGLPKGTMTI